MTAVTIQDLDNAQLDCETIADVATSLEDTAVDRLGHLKLTLTGAINSMRALNPRGAWATATAYAVRDLVTESGVVYIVTQAHTSGTFATDLAAGKLAVYQGLIGNDLASTSDATKGANLVGWDGVPLSETIKSRLNRVVASVSALAALDTTKYTRAFATGFAASGDGGGGDYWFDGASSATAIPGVVIVPSVGSGRWKLIIRGALSVMQTGAKGDGTTDDAAACQAAIDARSEVYFPEGTYKLSTGLTQPIGSRLRGAGIFKTILAPAANNLAAIARINGASAIASLQVSDLSIDASITGVAYTGVTGIKYTLCQDTEINTVRFAACSYDFDIDRGRFHNLRNLRSSGTAIAKAGRGRLWSSSDSDYLFQAVIDGYFIENIGNGTQGPALTARRVVGSQFGHINANDLNAGNGGSPADFVVIENDCQGLKLHDSMCAGAARGVLTQTGSGVSVAPSFITIVNNDFDQSWISAVQIASGNWIEVIGGHATASGVNVTGTCYNIGAANHVIMKGLVAQGYTGTNGTGFNFSGTINFLAEGNIVESCNIGFGIGASTQGNIEGNRCRTVTTPLAGSYSQAGMTVRNNPGLNPVLAVTAPAFPGSGALYTNNTGVPVRINWGGGTVSALAINGVGGFLSMNTFILNPGETASWTYSATPGWSFAPM